jgi:hypothetical protein
MGVVSVIFNRNPSSIQIQETPPVPVELHTSREELGFGMDEPQEAISKILKLGLEEVDNFRDAKVNF